MTTAAVFFWLTSWAFVLGLTIWSFARVLGHQRHFDPDGIGPAVPPEPPAKEPDPRW